MYCPHCDSEVATSVRIISETYPVKGEDTTIFAHVRVCNSCGEEIWDDELDAKNLLNAYAAYRKNHQLLQPADIRAIREKYGLTQTAFARVLGFGDKTITRYENGSIADAAQNNLIELMQQPSSFETLLRKNRDKISEQDYIIACTALETLRCQIVYSTKTAKYNVSTSSVMHYSTTQYWGDRLA